MNPKTRKHISRKVGLPFELIPLVDLNIDNYIKYKYGKTIEYPETFIDGYPTATIKKAEETGPIRRRTIETKSV